MTVVFWDCLRLKSGSFVGRITIRVKTSITNITAQGCCKLASLATQTKTSSDYNTDPATVFHLLGQGSKRNLSPPLPLQPYNPEVTTVVRSMRPQSRNPLFPFTNGLSHPHSSSRPSNSSPTSGILRGNPPVTLTVFIFICIVCVTRKMFDSLQWRTSIELKQEVEFTSSFLCQLVQPLNRQCPV